MVTRADFVEAVRAAAYGSAFAAELARACHGQASSTTTRVGEGVETVTETIDARAAAARWATEAADAATASLEGA